MHFPWQSTVQEAELLGGPGGDFLRGVAFWSIRSSGLQNELARGRQLCTPLSIFEGSLAEFFRF